MRELIHLGGDTGVNALFLWKNTLLYLSMTNINK